MVDVAFTALGWLWRRIWFPFDAVVAVGVGMIGMVLGDIHSYFYLANMIFGDIDLYFV